jgi:hypothetical protein
MIRHEKVIFGKFFLLSMLNCSNKQKTGDNLNSISSHLIIAVEFRYGLSDVMAVIMIPA